MSLSGAWFADRAPGLGKQLIVSGNTVGLSGVVIVGQPSTGGGSSTNPIGFPALPEPGSTIPPAGSADRAAFFVVFKNAVGFDGQTLVTGWNGAGISAKQTGFALSAWVNFGIQNVPGFVPNPLQGMLFDNESGASTPLATLYPGSGLPGSAPCSAPSIWTSLGSDGVASGVWVGATGFTNEGGTTAYSFPGNGTVSAGWVHLMCSWRFHPINLGATEDVQIVVNDTVFTNVTNSFPVDQTGYLDFRASGDATLQSIGGDRSNPPTAGWYGAVAEYVLYPRFIDWTLQANRYKFQVTDGVGAFQTWAPCDIGPSGRRPGFGAPLLYCTGGPSQFVYNRAAGATLTVSTGTSGLITIDSPPS